MIIKGRITIKHILRMEEVMGKAKSLEEILNELGDIVDKMSNEELTLEESFKMYEQGIKLCKQCNDKIDKVEKQLEIMEGEE